jgi:hypothetical protein
LTVDTLRFLPAVKELLARATPVHISSGASDVEMHIAQLIRTFGALVAASDQFRIDCRSSRLGVLKGLATSLKRECDALSRAL